MDESTEPAHDCPFCEIAQGVDISAKVLKEWPDAVAFTPLEPATRGHTLVIPKRHYRDYLAITDEGAVSLWRHVIEMSRTLQSALNPDGMNLITSAGAAATQTVYHLHYHVVPRFYGDRLGDFWPAHGEPVAVTEDAVRRVHHTLQAENGR